MGDSENEEVNFDKEVAEASVPKKRVVKRVAKPKSGEEVVKARKPKSAPPPVDDGEEEEKPAPAPKSRATKAKAAAPKTKKRTRDPLPEEEEAPPEGKKKPVRAEQNVTSAFNTLQNKRGGVILRPDDAGYFCLADLRDEYREKGAEADYVTDPRYIEAEKYFDKVNAEWNAEMAQWKEDNKALAEYNDRLRAARRRRTAAEKAEAERLRAEKYENMEVTIKAIGTGLVPFPGVSTAVSNQRPVVTGDAPRLSMHDVVSELFKFRSSTQRALDDGSAEFMKNIVPNFAVEYKGAATGVPKKKKAKVVPVVEDEAVEDHDMEELE